MYILRNSCKNLFRNKGRNLMIFLISMLTLTSVILSFSIQTLSGQAIQKYKDSFGVKATIQYDWEKLEKDFPPKTVDDGNGNVYMESSFELPEISTQQYLDFAKSEYVKKADFAVWCSFASSHLSKVPDNTRPDEEVFDISGMTKEEIKKKLGFTTDKELIDHFGSESALEQALDSKKDMPGNLCGYTDYSDLSGIDAFANGESKLAKGTFPAKDNECTISSKFAEHNKLKIGDVISVSGPSKTKDTKEIPLTVVGIYDANALEASGTVFGDLYGDVYTTMNTLLDAGFHWTYVQNAVYVLKNPDSAKAFEKELYEKGLSKYAFLQYSNAEYENNTKPLENISRIAEIFTLSAASVGAVILLLVSFLAVRERKYEIGVLRSMGMKKSGVAKGMVYETGILMLISLGISIGIGFILTKPIAAALLGTLTDIGISLPKTAILFDAGLAVGLGVLAGLCAVFVVMRHEPMKILSERN